MEYVDKFDAMESLLKGDPQAARERAAQAFDRISGAARPQIVLFGAGGLGQRVARGLRKGGVEPVAFLDSNGKSQGQTVVGVPVCSPAEAARRFSPEAVFVVSIWRALATETMHQRMRFLTGLGCTKVCSVFPLFWKFPDIFLPYYCADAPHKVIAAAAEVRATLELFADESSRVVFIDQILWRLDPERYDLDSTSREAEYFPKDLFSVHDREIYVDCGGYDGDTARQFLEVARGYFGAIHIVEPDPSNYSRVNAWRSRLPSATGDRIHVHNVAASNDTGTVGFSANSALDSRITQSGELQVPCDSLDGLLPGVCPTIIKMDIEGAERLALQGAEQLIQRCRPILAICLYHVQSDLWTIPLMIQRFAKGYRFFLRSHSLDGWDLVLYAVPTERANVMQPV